MSKRGFTLMELLIVVVIVAGLAAVTYPSYKSNLERTRASEAVNMVATIKTAQQKHFVNYEEYGQTFQDINDFAPATDKFDPTSDHFDSEYFRYTINSNDANVTAERIDLDGNLIDKGYSFTGIFTESFIRCNFTDDEGEKVCSSLTDKERQGSGSNTYYPIY